MYREDMRYDVRTLRYRVLRKELGAEAIQAHLDALPDDAAEAVETSTRMVATSAATQTQQGDDSDED